MKLIDADAAIESLTEYGNGRAVYIGVEEAVRRIEQLPSAQPERLTDDDFETIRIHLNAYKEKLCNQQRWEEAEEYQRIIDRFMAFASAQPETNCSEIPNNWIPCSERLPKEREWIGTKHFGTTISDEVYVTFEAPDGQRFADHISFQNGKLSRSDEHRMKVLYKGAKPIAWTPLPEVYKGEQK